MGRPPLHQRAMSDAERQRRRRARLREQPWICARPLACALAGALRDLQDPRHEDAAMRPEQLALLVDRALARLEDGKPSDDAEVGVEARAFLGALLSPHGFEAAASVFESQRCRERRRSGRARSGTPNAAEWGLQGAEHGQGCGHDHTHGHEHGHGHGQPRGRGRHRRRGCGRGHVDPNRAEAAGRPANGTTGHPSASGEHEESGSQESSI